MLVLTRKLDESIKIGDDIKVTILRVKGNTIRLGIEAPREVRVIRSELEAAIQAQTEPQQESPMVTAVVDSPAIASPRLFVGKAISKADSGAKLGASRLPGLSLNVDVNEVSTGSLLPTGQAGPLRDFLRSAQGLSAVS